MRTAFVALLIVLGSLLYASGMLREDLLKDLNAALIAAEGR